jgi:hypothetical protein
VTERERICETERKIHRYLVRWGAKRDKLRKIKSKKRRGRDEERKTERKIESKIERDEGGREKGRRR